MAFFENISLALGNLRSNKMRSLLTMLGIIIGIAAVIAIETIGNSMTGAVTDSMSGLGVSNITVSLTQKTESDQSAMSGVQLRLFMDSTPSDGDLLTDEMIDEYTAAFPTQVADVQKTVTVGSGTLDKYGDPTTTITASVSGVNRAVLDDLESDTPLLAGRWLRDDDGDRRICVVSEKFVQQTMGCTNAEAVGRQVTLTISNMPYTFYVAGVYTYDDTSSSMFGTVDDDAIQTSLYIPLDTARAITGDADGYQTFTVQVARRGGHQQLCDHHRLLFCQLLHPQRHLDSGGQQPFHPGGTADQHAQHHQPGASRPLRPSACWWAAIGVMNIMTVSVTERTPRDRHPARRWAPATRPSACSLSPSQWCFA